MREHLARLRDLAQPKPPKPKTEPILPRLARPFYDAVGYKLDGDIALSHLRHWNDEYWLERRERPPEIAEGQYRAHGIFIGGRPFAFFPDNDENYVQVPNNLPAELSEFISHLRSVEKSVLQKAFYDIGLKFETIQQIREAEREEIFRKLGQGTATFCYEGFGRVEKPQWQ